MATLEQTFQDHRARAQQLRLEDVSARHARLKSLRRAIVAHEDKIAAALKADLRKHPLETEISEVGFVLRELDHVVAHLESWAAPRAVSASLGLFGTESWIRVEPRGASLIMAPWNYPFQLLFTPLVGALAAGCTAILKPSELAPATARVSRELVESAFAANEVKVVEGGLDLAQELLALPFDHIFFTGSPAVGRKVMVAAAQHLSSVTLELGGKSPVILCDDADFEAAAERVTWGKFMNAGQTCVAPDYVLLPRARVTGFAQLLQQRVAAQYGADEAARERSDDFARIVNERHFTRLRAMVESSVTMGAKVECGARFNTADRYVAPTVLSGVNAEMPCMQEEIFGPVLPLVSYDTLEEAIAFVNKRSKPLALYVFSASRERAERVLAHCPSGGACVNQVVMHLVNPELPFGGVGESGQGASNGHAVFRAFSHERGVMRQGFPDLVKRFYAPYTDTKLRITRLLRRL